MTSLRKLRHFVSSNVLGSLPQTHDGGACRSLSVVVPIYNEAENLDHLYNDLNKVLPGLDCPYEIILVDDGSTDGSQSRLREIANLDPQVRVVLFRKNYGQTAAMQAGLQLSSNDVVVTMDGDLQNDPSDIPMMLGKISQGYDLVHGWRKERKDAWINRRLPSQLANWLISKTTGFQIHDLGCTLKAMRREIAQDLELYGEMHRFIPILAHQRGARCIEVVTKHHPRRFGKTKYGIGRSLRVVLDLLTVKFLLDYLASPMKLFGMIAVWCFVASGVSGFSVMAMKILGQVDMTGNPLLLLTVLLVTTGIQFLSLGLLSEVNARTYYGSVGKQHFAVRELLNFETLPGDVPVEYDEVAA
ncbi:MAG: glycosyltransferase [Planctomycetaceae bacterium]|nr:glycosyltransferase [Planctomycetaceae bacterium]